MASYLHPTVTLGQKLYPRNGRSKTLGPHHLLLAHKAEFVCLEKRDNRPGVPSCRAGSVTWVSPRERGRTYGQRAVQLCLRELTLSGTEYEELHA